MIVPCQPHHASFLADESRLSGNCSSLSFPETEEEVAGIVREMAAGGTNLTVQGGRTGICGGAVPLGGHLMHLGKMNGWSGPETTPDGETLLRAQAGMTLEELERVVETLDGPGELFFPPDPSETTATLGGIAATAAKGMRAHRYGETAGYVRSMTVIDGRGETMEVPGKSAFWGSEGILGIVTALTLRLVAAPAEIWGVCLFFGDRGDACSFGEEMLREGPAGTAVLEYLDRASLDLLQEAKPAMAKIRELPDIPGCADAMIYTEIHAGSEEAAMEAAEELLERATRHHADPDLAWAVSTPRELRRLRTLRHAAAEAALQRVGTAHRKDPRIVRLGAEWFLPGAAMESVIGECQRDMDREDLAGCIAGTVAGNQFQVSLFPQDYAGYERGQALLKHWARSTRQGGGSAYHQHGIGKLRRDLFLQTADPERIDRLRALKDTHDPAGILNRGTLINASLPE